MILLKQASIIWDIPLYVLVSALSGKIIHLNVNEVIVSEAKLHK